MLSKKWRGNYTYNNNIAQKAIGFDKTNFEIEIISFESNKFTGKVADDKNSGGMPGVGIISGSVNGKKIEFIKKMPQMSVISNNKLRTIPSKKHRPIYYSGIISEDSKSISGEWKFKFGIGFNGFTPMIFLPTSGLWSMNATE